ncbi:uncharacterized protein LOC101726552 [Heterocephalus glaber]|uniref:Uncharacterized protein LOC101726552 n=1 Tax=Heterocephalus glaber TaxID=10181 RepID=A0AAX6SWP5_HETGA|nr:uncharacterized protein LOC101726552 [Heterocephalus glaber]
MRPRARQAQFRQGPGTRHPQTLEASSLTTSPPNTDVLLSEARGPDEVLCDAFVDGYVVCCSNQASHTYVHITDHFCVELPLSTRLERKLQAWLTTCSARHGKRRESKPSGGDPTADTLGWMLRDRSQGWLDTLAPDGSHSRSPLSSCLSHTLLPSSGPVPWMHNQSPSLHSGPQSSGPSLPLPPRPSASLWATTPFLSSVPISRKSLSN